MSPQSRLDTVLNRLATATSVRRTRSYDDERASRNGAERDQRLEEAVTHFEAAADELWSALGIR